MLIKPRHKDPELNDIEIVFNAECWKLAILRNNRGNLGGDHRWKAQGGLERRTTSEREKGFGHKERRADSRALRHTPKKTERTRRLVLVYDSQNANVEGTQVPRGWEVPPKLLENSGGSAAEMTPGETPMRDTLYSTLVIHHSDTRIKIWTFIKIVVLRIETISFHYRGCISSTESLQGEREYRVKESLY